MLSSKLEGLENWWIFLLLMGPIWQSQRVYQKRRDHGQQWRAKWNPIFDLSTYYPCHGLASPENIGWNLKALEGSNVSYLKKLEIWELEKNFTRLIARSIATTGYLPIPKRSLPLFPNSPPPLPFLPHSHHHHNTIMIITYSVSHPCVMTMLGALHT